MRRLVSVVLLLLAACAAHAQEAKWVGSWGASPLPPSPGAGPFPATPSFSDQAGRPAVPFSVRRGRRGPRPPNGFGRQAQAIVVLGDSISDGVGSTAGANRRWPDLFAERLSARGGGTRFGVVNEGISGNQVLGDGAGQSALARFDRDVLSVPGLTHVIVFEGVNDLGLGYG